MDFLLAILPISFLIYVMTKKNPWPSHFSLPFAAILVYLLVLIRSRLDPILVNATVVNGTLYVGSLDGNLYAFGVGDR